LFLLPSYLLWGLSPIFWKTVEHVSSFELILHRSIWSFFLLITIVLVQGRTREIKKIFSRAGIILSLLFTMLILASNWFVFIWAVNSGRILQTSLGYYINPLLFVLLGMFFLKERLRKLQVTALIFATSGVLYFSITLGTFPWVAIMLAISFSIYGLIHKRMDVEALPGLCVETMLLSVPAVIYLLFLNINGKGAFLNIDIKTDLLLVGTCLFTALPLLFFTAGARRTSLSTVGFMQYIAPSSSFLLAVFIYHEPFSSEKFITFVMIWAALFFYTIDLVKHHGQNN